MSLGASRRNAVAPRLERRVGQHLELGREAGRRTCADSARWLVSEQLWPKRDSDFELSGPGARRRAFLALRLPLYARLGFGLHDCASFLLRRWPETSSGRPRSAQEPAGQATAALSHRRAPAGRSTNKSAVQAATAAPRDLAGAACVCPTFELRRGRRRDARPGPVKMYRVPPARAWWPAVGPRLDRGVRRRWCVTRTQFHRCT